MRKLVEAGIAVAGLALLSGCGGGNPNAPTAEEDRLLNNSAAMLDEQQDASPDSLTVEEAPIGNGDAPAQTGEVLVTDESEGTEAAANSATATNAQ